MRPKRVRAAMILLGMSIGDMSSVMGVHRDTISRWLRGKRVPGDGSARLIELMIWMHKNHPAALSSWLEKTIELNKAKK